MFAAANALLSWSLRRCSRRPSMKLRNLAKQAAGRGASAVPVDDGRPVRFSDGELERYARHIVLPQVGGIGQRKLREASVAVIGAGGIGSAVIPALAGAGIGRMTIVDDD